LLLFQFFPVFDVILHVTSNTFINCIFIYDVQCAVTGCKLKQNANEGCNSCASLAGLVLSFVACFILLVIAPLMSAEQHQADADR